LNERLPEPTRTPAIRPSWPERDQTALAPPSVEQSYLRPFSRSAVRDREHRTDDSVLLSGRSDGVHGERYAMTTVHRPVQYLVHLNLAVNFHQVNEIHSDKSQHSDAKWLGVGLERPVFTATKCVAVAPAQHRRLRDEIILRSEQESAKRTRPFDAAFGEEGNFYALHFHLHRLPHPAHSPCDFKKGSSTEGVRKK